MVNQSIMPISVHFMVMLATTDRQSTLVNSLYDLRNPLHQKRYTLGSSSQTSLWGITKTHTRSLPLLPLRNCKSLPFRGMLADGIEKAIS
jgi:hypothetical protein